MHALYKLRETLCKELEEYAERKQLDANSLEMVDTLAHALKNIDKVLENKEMEGYSEARGYSNGTIDDGMGHYHWPQYTRVSNRRSLEGSNRGSYRRSMDGYSRTEDMINELERIMDDAPDDKSRKELERMISKLEKN